MVISSSLLKPRRRLPKVVSPMMMASSTALMTSSATSIDTGTWCHRPCTTASLKAT
jgi:hypothetical protein